MVRSVDWVLIIGGPVWWCLGGYVTLGKMFYSLIFKQELVAVIVTATFCSYRIPRGGIY